MKVEIKNDFVLRVKMLYSTYILCIYSPSTSSIYQCHDSGFCCSGACENCFLTSSVLLLFLYAYLSVSHHSHSSFSFLMQSSLCIAALWWYPSIVRFHLCRAFHFLSLHVFIRISLAAKAIDFAFWIEYDYAYSKLPKSHSQWVCGILNTSNKVSLLFVVFAWLFSSSFIHLIWDAYQNTHNANYVNSHNIFICIHVSHAI